MARKKCTDSPPTFTMCQKSAIVRWACLDKQISTQIKTEKSLPYTCQTESNVLQKNSNVTYAKLGSRPPLTKLQKKLRSEFSKKHV